MFDRVRRGNGRGSLRWCDLGVLKKVLVSMEWWKFVPDLSILAGEGKNVATRSTPGDAILVYVSSPAAASICMDKIAVPESVQATWIDVRTGEQVQAGTFPNRRTVPFTSPSGWEDALLLLH